MLKTKKEAKIFPAVPRLHPDNAICDELAEEMDDTLVPVAVGSGVINDIVKRASGVAEIPYCCVPTAASVDGYTSYGAALSVDVKSLHFSGFFIVLRNLGETFLHEIANTP